MALTQERFIQKVLTEDYRCPVPTLQISLLWKESEQRDSQESKERDQLKS